VGKGGISLCAVFLLGKAAVPPVQLSVPDASTGLDPAAQSWRLAESAACSSLPARWAQLSCLSVAGSFLPALHTPKPLRGVRSPVVPLLDPGADAFLPDSSQALSLSLQPFAPKDVLHGWCWWLPSSPGSPMLSHLSCKSRG